jgi:arginyl-tRNA synthetase
VFRKAAEQGVEVPAEAPVTVKINDKEKNILRLLHEFPAVVQDSGKMYNPSLIANYIYDLVKEFNQFYHEYSILKEDDPEKKALRLVLSGVVSGVVKNGMELLGIEMPERM